MKDDTAREELAGLVRAIALVPKHLRPEFRVVGPPDFFYRVAQAAGCTYRLALENAATGDKLMGIAIEVVPGMDRYPIVCRADGLIADCARGANNGPPN